MWTCDCARIGRVFYPPEWYATQLLRFLLTVNVIYEDVLIEGVEAYDFSSIKGIIPLEVNL
jgi:hypothetical protein